MNKRKSHTGYKRISKKSLNPPKRGSTKISTIKNNSKNNIIIHSKRKSAFPKLGSVVLMNNKINIINRNNNNHNIKNKQNDSIDNTNTINKFKSKKSIDLNNNKIKFSNLGTEKGDINEEKKDDFELNNLEYLEAIKCDNRNLIQIYWSILKREHIIIFTFFIRNDYNLVPIKFTRFIFLLCTDMALNVFFFTDESMHKVYKNYGKYDFVQQIPQIIYSTVVSQILELILCYLSLTDKHVYQIKAIKDAKLNTQTIFNIIRCVKIKLIGFYSFTLILFSFYWYLISSFCSVYQNTQLIFIKDSISSFLLGLLYPFVLYLFPAIFRIISLKDRVKKRLKFIFFLSDIIPFF